VNANVFLGRRPVLNRNGDSIGFALSLGDKREQTPRKTGSFVELAMLEWGFEHLLGDHVGYIKADAGLIEAGILNAVTPTRTIIELGHDVPFDNHFVDTIVTARNAGARLAVEAFDATVRADIDQVGALVDIVRIDVEQLDLSTLPTVVANCRTLFPQALLLASSVEYRDVYRTCVEVGFDLFEGYFFSRPDPVVFGQRRAGASGAVLLLSEVTRPDIDLDRIESLISADPGLAYAIMRLVNSSAFGLSVTIQSVHHAIVMVGFAQIRQLAVVLTMAQNSQAGSPEVVVLSALRAHFASELAAKTNSSAAFTTGLLSVIDAVFNAPMEELLADIPLPADVTDALLHRAGPLGEVLDVIEAFEQADIERLEQLRPGQSDSISKAYAKSVEWSENIRTALAGRTD
jgi:EAL and modified HD-GYP domain-containing signal transduction protein